MAKKKKHNTDYSEFHYNGDMKKLMTKMADGIEYYLDTVTRYMIIENIEEDEYKSAVRKIKKLIKKLRAGDTSVLNSEAFNELTDSGHGNILMMKDYE